jgi:CRISPR-associated protein Cmr3
VQQLSLRPVDTFFFRNHKPFTIGENASASGIFPPRLGTVYGSLRSAYIHYHSDFTAFANETDPQVKEWMGSITQPGKFSLRGVFVEYRGKLMLPLPADYQVVAEQQGDKQTEMAYPLMLKQDMMAGLTSDSSQWKLYGRKDEKSTSAGNGYLPLDKWKHSVLRKEDVGLKVERVANWLVREPKIGISRNNKLKVADEGMLYQLDMLRFDDGEKEEKPTFLTVLSDQEPDFSQVELVQLGGENRPWAIKAMGAREEFFTSRENEDLVQEIEGQRIARIILLTPAVWQYGSRPGCWQKDTDMLTLAPGLQVKLLTAVMDRPQVIGGWDIALKRPKKRKYAVPAGTVLYVQVEPGQAKALVEEVSKMKFTDELAHEGYGWAVCGTC